MVLRWLEMVDDLHGYGLSGQDTGAYRLLRTDDGGRRWQDVTPGAGTIHPSGPAGVHGRSTVIVSTRLRAGVFAVERSDDGGRTWRRSLPIRDEHGLGIGRPLLLDARRLYVALDEGSAAGSQAQALYRSDDGGRTWRFVSRTDVSGRRPRALPFGCDKNGFGFATASRGWAGGYCPGGPPFLYRTDDGGRSWRRQPLPGLAQCACNVSAPRFFTRRSGALDVIGFTMSGKPLVRVYWTSDGGDRWRASEPPAGRASGAVSYADARTAWLTAGPPGGTGRRFDRLYRTSDAGRRWQTVALPFDADGYQLDALGAAVAYAVRPYPGRSSILRTQDGGRSWRTIPTSR